MGRKRHMPFLCSWTRPNVSKAALTWAYPSRKSAVSPPLGVHRRPTANAVPPRPRPALRSWLGGAARALDRKAHIPPCACAWCHATWRKNDGAVALHHDTPSCLFFLFRSPSPPELSKEDAFFLMMVVKYTKEQSVRHTPARTLKNNQKAAQGPMRPHEQARERRTTKKSKRLLSTPESQATSARTPASVPSTARLLEGRLVLQCWRALANSARRGRVYD